MAFSDLFSQEVDSCRRIININSVLLVAKLTCPNEEADITTLTPAAAASGATTVSVTSNNAGDIYLRKGSVLKFGTKSATVTADTLVPTGAGATAVPVEALTAAITATDLATTYAAQRILSPMNIPTNMTSQKEDSTDLSQGINGSETVVKVTSSIQIQAFNDINDRALYEYVFDAARVGGEIFAMVVRGGSGITTFGRAIVSDYTDDGAVNTQSKPSFTLDFQGNFRNIQPYRYLSVSEKATLNNLRALFGLAALTA
jgi:hypothetical protein